MEQFDMEVLILAKCSNHPNIIKLYCIFDDEKYIYMVMELADE